MPCVHASIGSPITVMPVDLRDLTCAKKYSLFSDRLVRRVSVPWRDTSHASISSDAAILFFFPYRHKHTGHT